MLGWGIAGQLDLLPERESGDYESESGQLQSLGICNPSVIFNFPCQRLQGCALSDIGIFLWYHLFVSTLYDPANTNSVALRDLGKTDAAHGAAV